MTDDWHVLKTEITEEGKTVQIDHNNGQNLVTVYFPAGSVIGKREISLEFIDVLNSSVRFGFEKEHGVKMLTNILRLTQPMDCIFLRPVSVIFPPTNDKKFWKTEFYQFGKQVRMNGEVSEIRSTVFSPIGIMLDIKDDVSSIFVNII